MDTHTKRLRILIGCMLIFTATGAMASAPAASQRGSETLTGNLVNLVAGARASRPFILTIDRYSSEADVQRIGDILATRGPYSLRDALWARQSGVISFGGGIGYPVSVAVSRDTPTGRTVRVFLNRPLSAREVQYATRSSKYPFGYIELTLDKDGRGQGTMIGAAKLKLDGSTLEVTSLGVMPIRLLDVRAE